MLGASIAHAVDTGIVHPDIVGAEGLVALAHIHDQPLGQVEHIDDLAGSRILNPDIGLGGRGATPVVDGVVEPSLPYIYASRSHSEIPITEGLELHAAVPLSAEVPVQGDLTIRRIYVELDGA